MNFAWSTIIGFCMGFGFGVGCALAVLYAIYLGGYRKALDESLMDPQPAQYARLMAKARAKSLPSPPSREERG